MSKFLLPFAEGQIQASVFSPAAMLVAAVVTGALISVQGSPTIVATLLLFIFIGGSLVRTRWRVVLSLAARFEFVILFWIFLEPFLYGSTVVTTLVTPFGSLNIYAEGITMGLLLGLRMMGLLLLFLVTLSHMTLADFTDALRTLHVPSVLIGSLMVMLRYIPLFLEERFRMQEAQILRGYHCASRREKITSLGYLVGSTIDRAFDRSIAVYEAMALRGFGASVDHRAHGFRRADLLLLSILALIIFTVQCLLFQILGVILSWSPL
ncbi:MAG: energy-coupling factor transporter transmembrane protein EcfT [Candidatus Thorarchaeota archaeon]|nr:energy-coupling factor transporter transmembrane protein EcfT [Candidatus Thorarchaeota archaeon]